MRANSVLPQLNARSAVPVARWGGVLAVLLLIGLYGRPSSALAQSPSTLDLDALEQDVAMIFGESCARAGCHSGPNPQQGMDLTRDQFYASIVDVPSRERPELKRVDPGQPDSSYVVMKIEGHPDIVGTRMPFTGETLSEDEVQSIRTWIRRLPEDTADRSAQASTSPAYPFDGWKVINLPTARALDAGSWLFLISHRFNPPLNQGYDAFFGLDGSGIIYLSLGYAITDDLLVALGRSNASDNVELQTRYQIAQQRGERGWPIGLSVQGTLNWVTEEPSPGDSRFRGEVLKFTGQVSLARDFGDRVGVAFVPGITFNPAEAVDGEQALLTLGLGARWNVYQNLALVGEWVPIVSGYTRTQTFGNDIRFDTWGGGLEIATAGHVFQIVVSNSVGLASDQYLRGGDLDIRDAFDGDLRLGFNIFRILNF
jgi:hypothetical protein